MDKRRTIFIEQVNNNGDDGEDGGDEHQLLVDDLVVQVAEPHRLEKSDIRLILLCNLKTDMLPGRR